MATNLVEVTNDTRRRLMQQMIDAGNRQPNPQLGETLRAQPAPDNSAIRQRMAAGRAAQVPPAPGPIERLVAAPPAPPRGMSPAPLAPGFTPPPSAPAAPPPSVIPKSGPMLAGAPAAAPASIPAHLQTPTGVGPAPGSVAAPPSFGQRVAQGLNTAGRELVPSFNGTSKIAELGGKALRGGTKLATRYAAPVLEGIEVAKVAMDPQASKTDVATQAAEGVAKTAGGWAGTLGGAAIGSAILPGPGTVIGGAIGGLGGYFGTDFLLDKARSTASALGLVADNTSPAERTQARIDSATSSQPTRVAGARTDAPNVTTNPNGSQVQTVPGGQVMTRRPTNEPAAPKKPAAQPKAAAAPAASPIAQVKNQAARATGTKAPAAAAPASPQMAAVQARIDALMAEDVRDLPSAGATVQNGLPTIDMATASQADPEWLARHTQRRAVLNELGSLLPRNPNIEVIQGGERFIAAPENDFVPVPAQDYRNTIAGVVMPNAIARSGDPALQQQFVQQSQQGALRQADPIAQQLALERAKDEGDVQAARITSAGGIEQARIQGRNAQRNVIKLDESTTDLAGATTKRQRAFQYDDETGTAREIAGTGPAPLPPGMVRQVGTSGGKPVYEDAQGKRFIAGN